MLTTTPSFPVSGPPSVTLLIPTQRPSQTPVDKAHRTPCQTPNVVVVALDAQIVIAAGEYIIPLFFLSPSRSHFIETYEDFFHSFIYFSVLCT
ncbi:hypothetical protein K435DRAFT_362408 [Dendrothele bispora CBS 962.96]|uniref:Uncharacterized protein n=1 Tax=Dendrothele bispora (strain CBS 962.96) TaxID=1314807 RepID=A0A4S8MHU0_DENBC|nr:hypothetical protein K435DRAFT_362408 [Dendrothele bispora CBS 962.96]